MGMSMFQVPTAARRAIVIVAACTTLACLGGECEDDKISQPPPTTISGVFPCAALPGETVRIEGFNLGGFVTIGGKPATVVSNNGLVLIARLAPDASGTSGVFISGFSGGLGASAQLKVLTGVAKVEVEPNDDINGANATDTGGEREGSGSLASAADKDHFRVDCLDPTAPYKIKVTPPTFGPVFVNGQAVTLDAAGEGTIPAGPMVKIIGLTGHQGDYSFELTRL